jgi:hypothetical protein
MRIEMRRTIQVMGLQQEAEAAATEDEVLRLREKNREPLIEIVRENCCCI